MNATSGYQIGGYDLTDLRDPDSARKVVAKLLEPYPEVPALRGNYSAPSTAVEGLSAGFASPMQGGFEFRTPTGWRVNSDQTVLVTATRDGRRLNEIKVELRPHNGAFPNSAHESERDSSPDQLAEWYAAELQSRQLPDLQIGEASLDAELAGRAAFRIRFSYRLPIEEGAARIEQKSLPSFEESARTIVPKRLWRLR